MAYDPMKFRMGEWTVVPIGVEPAHPVLNVTARVTRVDRAASTITVEIAKPEPT